MDAADFDRRVAGQPSDDYLRSHANTVMENVGDEKDLLAVLERSAEVDRTFSPDRANTELYRRFYGERMSVVKGMKGVFGTLKGMSGLR